MTRRSLAQMIWARIVKPVASRLWANAIEFRAACQIGDVSGKKLPGGAPVCPLIVADPAPPRRSAYTPLNSPRRIVLHAVGRVGHHQSWFDARQKRFHRLFAGAIAAGHAMRIETPDVARLGDWVLTDRRGFILAGKPGLHDSKRCRQLLLGEAELTKVGAEIREIG